MITSKSSAHVSTATTLEANAFSSVVAFAKTLVSAAPPWSMQTIATKQHEKTQSRTRSTALPFDCVQRSERSLQHDLSLVWRSHHRELPTKTSEAPECF